MVQFQFNGTWPKKKNWALENLPFRNEWVFILDADEVLPPEAEAEFREAIANAGAIAGYWINRRFMFLGRWLRHAYYPNWNLRLFRHSLGRYEKLTEPRHDSGDNEVHEHVVMQGPTGRLRCEMDHYAFPSVEVFIEKHNRYSNWEARVATERLLAGSSGQLRHERVNRRRQLKLLSHRLPFRRFSVSSTSISGRRDFSMGATAITLRGCTRIYEFLSVAKTLRAAGENESDVMRVVVWGINYAPEFTGIAPHNVALCDFLHDRGHDVEMVTTFPYYPTWQKRSEDRGQLYRTDLIKGVPVHRCWHFVPQRVSALKRILHEASFIFTSTLRLLTLPGAGCLRAGFSATFARRGGVARRHDRSARRLSFMCRICNRTRRSGWECCAPAGLRGRSTGWKRLPTRGRRAFPGSPAACWSSFGAKACRKKS